jgi:NIMA (never in mitosis gene a)-related kinase
MEFEIDGEISSKISLCSKQRQKFQEETIWSILIQILKGMKYLHENKIIHGNLRSSTIFLMKDGTVKIGGFNKSYAALNQLLRFQIEQVCYLSPEMWKSSSTIKSDIWSIGCIIYEMCQLKPPFQGTSFRNLAANIIKGIYPPISNIYSKDLCEVIKKMLWLDPHTRPSCDELLNSNVIKNKMKEVDNGTEDDFKNKKAQLIQTIKIPKNLKDIKLPQNQYKKKHHEDVMEHETGKDFEQTAPVNNNNKVIQPESQKQEPKAQDYSSNQQQTKHNEINEHLHERRSSQQDGHKIVDNNDNNAQRPVIIIKRNGGGGGIGHKPIIIGKRLDSNNEHGYNLGNDPLSNKLSDIGNKPQLEGPASSEYNRIVMDKNVRPPSVRENSNDQNKVIIINKPNAKVQKIVYERMTYNQYLEKQKNANNSFLL